MELAIAMIAAYLPLLFIWVIPQVREDLKRWSDQVNNTPVRNVDKQ